MNDTLTHTDLQKQCKSCTKFLPHTAFGIHSKTKDGLRTICRSCRSIPSSEKYCEHCQKWKQQNQFLSKDHKHEIKNACKECRDTYIQINGIKYCRACHTWLPQENYDTQAQRKDGLSGTCRTCKQSAPKTQPVTEKHCDACRNLLPIDAFEKEQKNKDGHKRSCRECRSIIALNKRTEEKQCPGCLRILHTREFSTDRRKRDGLRNLCRPCKNKENDRYRTPESRSDYHLQHNYKMTQETYNTLLLKQNGLCAICKMPETLRYGRGKKKGEIKNLAVDHCHTTHQVRALLCQRCNTSLGLMQEEPEIIQALQEYAQWCKSLKQS